ncbi:cytochrome c biogenesis protein DipZ [Candidatus Protochlamydia phocaeensis]|uniref:cytochrome c biogenesis protein DipZ n=1 Tax=Candidatus Protochlamydia phocaeensis TaxID=1414722 RepID=UPI000837DF17|nr:cytochrome c biogenesis protein DipZ [Candidatus Protochlamydia phocaeensis]
MILLLLFSFLAGIVTVLSPCILPVLPVILSASVGKGKWRPFGVIAGLIISFVFFTLALTTLVRSFGLSANVLRYTAILIIGFFGLVMILPTFSNLFAKLTGSLAEWGNQIQARTHRQTAGFWSGFFLGIALGLVWTPCAGPILAAITTLVATQKVTIEVVLLTFAYSLGAGIPLLFVAYGGNRAVSEFPALAKYSEEIRMGFGVIMILTALALAFNWDVAFQQKVLDYLPNIQIENNTWVQQQLQHLRSPAPSFPNQDNSPWEEQDNPSVPSSSHQQAEKGEVLPIISKAPPIVGIADWINSPPLTLKDLRGKVVLIDFWTYSCINCIRTFPYLKRWYERYKDQNFVIIGVHTPEFEFEKNLSNVKKAVERFQIVYPVALDNQYATWESYHNAYWPAHYLIDQEGMIREVHFGEGGYTETENAIRSLLNEKPLSNQTEEPMPAVPISITPETYLGYHRAGAYVPALTIHKNQFFNYNSIQSVGPNQVGLKGDWKITNENILAGADDSILVLNFMANRVYLVLGGSSSLPIKVELDGEPLPLKYHTVDMNPQGEIFVKDARKYDIVNLRGEGKRRLLVLHVPKGIQAYAFTFGMEE